MVANPLSDILRQARGEQIRGDSSNQATTPEQADGPDEFRCYAKLRGPNQSAFMLELRFANGNGEAFDYGLLGRIQFDRSGELRLQFANGTVTIRGKNLRPLFEGLKSHQVMWVGEAIDPKAERDPEACLVTKIEVQTEG